MKIQLLFVTIFSLVIVSGCSPKIGYADKEKVVIEFDPNYSDLSKASKLATKHCQTMGKEAVLGPVHIASTWQNRATYQCQ